MFDTNAWKYDLSGGCYIQLYTDRYPFLSPGTLKKLGGKYGSLRMCELFAKRSNFLKVPEWYPLRAEDFNKQPDAEIEATERNFGPGNTFIRSSAEKEDWLDPASGVFKSFPSCRIGRSALKSEIGKVVNECGSVILQKMIGYPGSQYNLAMGFVVDVGYSQILQKPVVRVSHGRRLWNESNATSATWDEMAPAGIYDAETGEPIISLRTQYSEFAPTLALEFVKHMKDLELNFGMQFEIIEDSDKWYLVQARPSPGIIQGVVKIDQPVSDKAYWTPHVNRVGNVQGKFLTFDRCLETPTGKALMDFDFDNPDEFKGMVVGWLDEREGFNPMSWVGLVKDVGLCGAVGQFGHQLYANNRRHAYVYRVDEYQVDAVARAKQLGIQMRIDAKGMEQEMKKLLHSQGDGTKTVRMVSDGLIGAIEFFE